MKVISGFLKGRSISGYNIIGTRPTMDRVKESLFGMIQEHVKGSIVLDLFAGSGSLGIEAISNGAKECYFIDNNQEVIQVLNKNVLNFDIAGQARVRLLDWKRALNDFFKMGVKFDIIFVDPPYEYDVYEKVIRKVIELNLLQSGGIIVLEHRNLLLKDNYGELSLYKEKKYGDKSVNIYQMNWQYFSYVVYFIYHMRRNREWRN